MKENQTRAEEGRNRRGERKERVRLHLRELPSNQGSSNLLLALSCPFPGSGDVQSFIWPPRRQRTTIHDSIVSGDHRESHAGCDLFFLLFQKKKPLSLSNPPALGRSPGDNSNFFSSDHRLEHTYELVLLILFMHTTPPQELHTCSY